MCSQRALHLDRHRSMTLPEDSPSFGNHTADFGSARLDKIAPAFAKEGRDGGRHLDSACSEAKMNKKESHPNGAEPVRIWKARNFIHEHCNEEISLQRVAQAA